MVKFKWLHAALTVALLSSMLAGCSGSNKGTEATNSPASTAKAVEATEPAKPKLDPVELSWYVIGPEQPKDTESVEKAANEYLKDKINATIKFKVLDWGSFDAKSNAMFASNEAFDIIFTAYWKNYSGNVVKGAYLPINELMDKYAPKTKALFKKEYLEGAQVEGKLYAIPANKDKAAAYGLLYRKDITDKLGLNVSEVKKYEDWEAILQAVKEKEPNLIPFGSQLSYEYLSGEMVNLAGQFATVYSNLSPNKDDLKVYNKFEMPYIKKSLDLMRKWYTAGYIRKDIATYKGSSVDDFNKGLVFSFGEQLKPGKDKELEASLKSNGVNGAVVSQIELTKASTAITDITGSMMAISKTSKNPERAMMFLELFNTDPYLNNLFNFGIESTHYKKVSETVIEPMADRKWPFTGANWILGNQYINYLLPNEDPQKWKKFEQFNNSAILEKGVGFEFNQEPVKTQKAQIDNVVTKYGNALFFGALDPNEYLPKLQSELKKAGAEEFVAEVQKQYDAWRTKTGKK